MFARVLTKIFGTQYERDLKALQPIVDEINALEPKMQQLSDDELKAQTAKLKGRLAAGETLDALLPEAFATVREVSVRVMGMRHFDVQLIGGIVLHNGSIAEMKTGEGKTLMSTLPVYLNALAGKGVHVVTVNDYLASRDAAWMAPIYHALDMTVGTVVAGMSEEDRHAAYRADCTYGTNNEFGFDYLRDNMKFDRAHFAQRELHYAIIDEVDSILIDEARTPLIISGPAEVSTQLYYQVNQIMPALKKDAHYTVDEKAKSAILTDDGVKECEKRLKVDNLFDPRNITMLHHVNQALRAHALFQRDSEYVVKDGKVIIVDEFTGRLMDGRRWSDGLHQAVEAKEGVRIENENQTLASITFQNLFRMYDKLSGMTGTAETEAEEFGNIYSLDVMVVPTNRPLARDDQDDLIYKTQAAKQAAIIEKLRECQEKGQPVLVGTVTIDKSEELSAVLKKKGIKHNVLNAKQHDREADIVAQAGRLGAVTISTNMAGRGTDIKLGGNPEAMARSRLGSEASPEAYEAALKEFEVQCAAEREEVLEAGGLFILGTERHESRRIDNQLRGRAGRQGDPGVSCFYLSLDDDLLRIFGGDRIKSVMERMGMEEDEVIEHRWLNRAIENAQHKVEQQNFGIRKRLLEYDDVMNQQRTQLYALRKAILAFEEPGNIFLTQCETLVGDVVDEFVPEKITDAGFDRAPMSEKIVEYFNVRLDMDSLLDGIDTRDAVGEKLFAIVEQRYHDKVEKYGASVFGPVERYLLLTTLDAVWKDHLLQMDHVKESVSLSGYAQKNPLTEYKRSGFDLFHMSMFNFARDVVQKIFRVEIKSEEAAAVRAEDTQVGQPTQATHASQSAFASGGGGVSSKSATPSTPKVGRNDPCPCGSGKKYKKCHGV